MGLERRHQDWCMTRYTTRKFGRSSKLPVSLSDLRKSHYASWSGDRLGPEAAAAAALANYRRSAKLAI
jgi:hypothetical protein